MMGLERKENEILEREKIALIYVRVSTGDQKEYLVDN